MLYLFFIAVLDLKICKLFIDYCPDEIIRLNTIYRRLLWFLWLVEAGAHIFDVYQPLNVTIL